MIWGLAAFDWHAVFFHVYGQDSFVRRPKRLGCGAADLFGLHALEVPQGNIHILFWNINGACLDGKLAEIGKARDFWHARHLGGIDKIIAWSKFYDIKFWGPDRFDMVPLDCLKIGFPYNRLERFLINFHFAESLFDNLVSRFSWSESWDRGVFRKTCCGFLKKRTHFVVRDRNCQFHLVFWKLFDVYSGHSAQSVARFFFHVNQARMTA